MVQFVAAPLACYVAALDSTEEYLHFLKEKKEAAGIKNHPTNHSFPACHAIPDAIYQGGLPTRPGFDKDSLGR